MPRLAIAMFLHEGNSFSPVTTDRSAFKAAVWCQGNAAAAAFQGTASEMGGACDFLAARPDWSGQFLRLAHAMPAGPIDAALFDETCDEIVAGLMRERFDAVYLALHGAMVVEGRDLADLEIIRRVRAAIGPDALLGVSFDMHANLEPEIAGLVDFASGYKTHPHVDQRETALRVLEGLERTLRGEIRPIGCIARTGAILPSINMRTDAGPMAVLEDEARSMLGNGVLEAVPFGGFSYADTIAAGASAMVFADGDPALAALTAARLRDRMDTLRDDFFVPLPDARTAIAQAVMAAGAGAGPVAVVDAGDNPLSGGILDTPAMLRALVDANPDLASLVVLHCDPGVVARAVAAGVGGTIDGTLGARLSARFGPPVPFTAKVRALAAGSFAARPPLLCGPTMNFGQLALLGLEDTRIGVIVSSLPASPHDPGLLEALGIDLAAIDLFCVKAKNHFRAAYAERFGTIIPCDAPGPAALDIAAFPFVRAPAHLYPLCERDA
ncbi:MULTISPECIES: M81 family metallopeptidase [unclassified Novosphingobium]|uniref:M81 family metallopeptidase n=1 Tax=unclassified Novosphingobium TaxID=2644732 RepID=UPI000F5D94EA|nr:MULTISPECIES: M81 family metallopeptidase [unclassified Novosphingobium]MBF5092845.1 M81 family metallopeptidase [Novosphingobium sp. NBM11]RQW44740.1 M81 family peptidase [Novosphingobium sp. LASN5T]